jgi:predicted metal-dependent hydrolase
VETETIETELGSVQIRRRKGRRRLSIILHPRKPIEVRANLKTSVRQIQSFLIEKQSWIQKNQAEFEKQKAHFPEKTIRDGEQLIILGRLKTLQFIQSPHCRLRTWVQGEKIVFSLPPMTVEELTLKHLLRDLYKKIAMVYLQQRVEVLSQRMQCLPSRLSFGEARSLWGSCHRSGHIRLNWKLIVFEPQVIDYVVIHELAHLRFLDHSPRFWHLVEQYSPEFRELRKKLKKSEFIVAFLERPSAGPKGKASEHSSK